MRKVTILIKRSSHPEEFLGKDFLKICIKFTGEHPRRRAISVKLQNIFTEIALRHACSPVNLLQIFRTTFLKIKFSLDGCFCIKLSKLWKIDAKILGTQIWRHITVGLHWNLTAIQLLIKIKPDFADGADFYRLKKSLWFLTR